MKDFGWGDKYLNLIRRRVPIVLRQAKTKLERRGNARNDPYIKVTLLLIAKKYYQFDPKGSLCGFVAYVCRNLVHISVKECLRFEGRGANYPVSNGSGHALRLLECRYGVHRDLLAHEVDQL